MEFNYLQRVKVYRLNDEGKWDDKGTGHVSVEYLERSDAVGLVVIDEEDNQTLLVHRISADDIYRRQEDTIISWTDPEVATDLALSFQETMGCSFIWDQICSVQRSVQLMSVGGMERNTRPVGDDLEHSGTSQDDDDAFRESGGPEVLELPPAELSNLPLIAKTVAEVMPFDRDRVASMIVRDQNYIPKLVQLFRTCEDLENLECLRLIFKIVKGIISLNDGLIFDIIFSDDYIMDIVGALEYDPDATNFHKHRTFLKDQVNFKEAVPIRDPVILSKIHQTYRIGYIKDVILPRVLDDATYATINSIMLFNNVSVVTALHNDPAFLSELFARLRVPETPERNRRDLVIFVQEFCNLSKHLQPVMRGQLFSTLVKEGLFDIVKDILKESDEVVRLSGCDILLVILNHDPTLLRTFLVHQSDLTLFGELVEGMLTPSEDGLQAQLLEIMRMLLDSETMDSPLVDKSLFLEIFYERYMDQMVQIITDSCPPESCRTQSTYGSSTDFGKQTRRAVAPEILGNICELMCFCVQHHRFRIKYYVMRNHVVEKILKLTRRKEKYLVVAAVRFLRTCVALKDEFYYRYIVKHNLFEPIIGAFVANGNRYNLLNSTVLELVDFIRKEGIKTLIVHLIEKYSLKFESIDYVDTFRALKVKYEQLLEGPSPGTRDAGGAVASGGPDHGSRSFRDRHNQAGFSDSRRRKNERELDKDEEDYFNQDRDDEEDTVTARVSTASQPQLIKAVVINDGDVDGAPFRGSAIGLVDYEDEDEDMPTTVSTNGKDPGEVVERSENPLPAAPLTDPVRHGVEDGTPTKRKTPLAPTLEETDATASKRLKPEDGHSVDLPNAQSSRSGIVDTSRVGSCTKSSEELSLSESTTLSPESIAEQDISLNVGEAKVFGTSSADLPVSGAEHQPSSSNEGTPDTSSELRHQDLDTAPSGTSATLPSDHHLSHESAETAAVLAAIKGEKVAASLSPDEDMSSHDVTGNVVRVECANGGESLNRSSEVGCTLATGSGPTENGVDCCSVEDCNGSASESSECLGSLPTKGVNDGNKIVPQQHNVNLGSEGNKLTNLGTEIEPNTVR
ncbi:uncharacterized protein [Physcomitrium patens]|uniref:Uncharacterized protein n=1 Tax=Physcomitrium patens TaxID=3218 RepID=A0A2K1KMH8_PHYPA|nr:serine/threonine-protein phosphatase 4 regulatory subunit 3B-like isoform X1 [Physcomitrium patens]XP_024373630.1 serine/threonine-protein phosphatase 4 regulatory subunit 3B-like isoform X1 [Physcomitrium patens]PNR54974.1 hypothetical protein PHYPA_005867 [Physcomitrium patens]|eukprot:XP_024373629.1 serine/threonine-protein phosphatase 4 regulatory subunit 3B-like isoform X1 [Physcomitrella patens]